MKEFLTEQLDRTNYWLTFSEAKNGALVALNIAIIAVCTQVDILSMIMQVTLCILFLASTICCLISFYPNLKDKTNDQSEDNVENSNFVFYGDVAKIKDSETYINCLKNTYSIRMQQEEKNICKDLAVEILINSKITMAKYGWFKKAVIIDVTALCFFIISLIIA